MCIYSAKIIRKLIFLPGWRVAVSGRQVRTLRTIRIVVAQRVTRNTVCEWVRSRAKRGMNPREESLKHDNPKTYQRSYCLSVCYHCMFAHRSPLIWGRLRTDQYWSSLKIPHMLRRELKDPWPRWLLQLSLWRMRPFCWFDWSKEAVMRREDE